ncbi:hypothetical protein GSI_14456 [Ganoderma sinense ZZ0214-1]|uniref:Uncharacterized protein n=1 Tax=Ganoderma sinense ZZ0214-1 TaxID=1077348 RepID=A0A2G8RNR1_9APHY|nr:hypothetical protein GSI_14456 [Ganoderma sinense ZZ0214-1]
MPSRSSHPPTRGQGIGRSSYAELPVKPTAPAPEALKRMIGIPDDKGNFGHFDLTMSHLEPPPPAKIAPPIPAHTIVLAQIPKKFRNAQFVRPWAKRYGNALRISVDIKAGKALVEWGSLAAAEAAFTSMRLRGDGREHIRAYRYIGARGASSRPKEIEEGEIEEGEVTEVVETKAKKKKKNKGKMKAQPEQRFAQPVAPAPVRAPLPASALPPVPLPARPPVTAPPPLPIHESLPRSPPAPPKDAVVPTAADIAAIIAAATALRPALEGISQPLHPIPPVDAEEEAMELDSGAEEDKTPPPPASTTTSAVTSSGEAEVKVEVVKEESEDGVVVEEDMDVEDEDMDMSSPIEGPHVPLEPESSPPPRSPRPSKADSMPTPAAPASPPPVEDEAVQAEQAAKDARRRRLEEAIARTKAQLALRENALSSRPSLVSSSGSSESPEPPTPVDSPHVNGVEVDVASASGDAIVVDCDPAEEADVVVKTESTTVTLDDLAVSFITESIQTASASSSSSSSPPSQPPATSSTAMLASEQLGPPRPIHRPNAIPIIAPVPTSKVAVMQPPPVRTPLTEEQKQAKRKKWLELVAGSSSLIDKIAAAKNKEEKSLLMRMLKSKTKAADELKREIDSGFALSATATPSTTPSSVASSSSSSLSATPTPVPFSRTPSATPAPTPSGTPVPTPTPGLNVPQKRRVSPPTGTAMSMSMFRWPETAREMIIIVSDDEAD